MLEYYIGILLKFWAYIIAFYGVINHNVPPLLLANIAYVLGDYLEYSSYNDGTNSNAGASG